MVRHPFRRKPSWVPLGSVYLNRQRRGPAFEVGWPLSGGRSACTDGDYYGCGFLYCASLLVFRPLLPCNSTNRDQDAISSTLRRYIVHASWMLNLPASMAASTVAFLLATQRTIGRRQGISAQGSFVVEVFALSSA